MKRTASTIFSAVARSSSIGRDPTGSRREASRVRGSRARGLGLGPVELELHRLLESVGDLLRVPGPQELSEEPRLLEHLAGEEARLERHPGNDLLHDAPHGPLDEEL